MADTFILEPVVSTWQFIYAPVILTAAGSGGCKNAGNRDGVQGTSDHPLLWDATALAANDDFIYVQEYDYGGIRQYNRRTRTISSLSGFPTNAIDSRADGIGAAAAWSWRTAQPNQLPKPLPMSFDGRDYIYAMDSQNNLLRQVNVHTGQTTTVYGKTKARCYTTVCNGPSCSPTCYSHSDTVCGTSALMAEPTGLVADPLGRYVYVADSLITSIRRIDTTTWCPTTLLAPRAGYVYHLLAHRNGQYLYTMLSPSTMAPWTRVDTQTGATALMSGTGPPRTATVTIGASDME
jgi:hypothetical protein